jgi:adenylate kinase
MEAGGLVPDEIVIKIIAERIAAPDCAQGYILDGFPRTLKQAAALDELLISTNKRIDAVIELKVDDAALIDRISGRYMCANCGASYHDTNCMPKVAGVCDRCGSKDFVRRSDDNAETVKNRLMAYYRETAPLIGYYFAKGKLKSVDGMAPISDVASQIEVILAGSTGP